MELGNTNSTLSVRGPPGARSKRGIPQLLNVIPDERFYETTQHFGQDRRSNPAVVLPAIVLPARRLWINEAEYGHRAVADEQCHRCDHFQTGL